MTRSTRLKKKNPPTSKLRKAAAEYPCVRCGKEHETRGAHYNGLRQYLLGKGRGIKCSDIAMAYFCQDCDTLFSEGKNQHWISKEERSEEFMFYCLMTMKMLYEDGVLKT